LRRSSCSTHTPWRPIASLLPQSQGRPPMHRRWRSALFTHEGCPNPRKHHRTVPFSRGPPHDAFCSHQSTKRPLSPAIRCPAAVTSAPSQEIRRGILCASTSPFKRVTFVPLHDRTRQNAQHRPNHASASRRMPSGMSSSHTPPKPTMMRGRSCPLRGSSQLRPTG
jgi:hypothetical protein